MKFWTVILDGAPRLDITAATKEGVSIRAAKVLGGQNWRAQKEQAKIVQVKLQMMV